jgi:hypothetical protein
VCADRCCNVVLFSSGTLVATVHATLYELSRTDMAYGSAFVSPNGEILVRGQSSLEGQSDLYSLPLLSEVHAKPATS